MLRTTLGLTAQVGALLTRGTLLVNSPPLISLDFFSFITKMTHQNR